MEPSSIITETTVTPTNNGKGAEMPPVKRGPGRPRAATTEGETEEARVGLQLDAESGRKLDELAKRIGEIAGEQLGITIRVTRTDVVRSLIDAKISELEEQE